MGGPFSLLKKIFGTFGARVHNNLLMVLSIEPNASSKKELRTELADARKAAEAKAAAHKAKAATKKENRVQAREERQQEQAAKRQEDSAREKSNKTTQQKKKETRPKHTNGDRVEASATDNSSMQEITSA